MLGLTIIVVSSLNGSLDFACRRNNALPGFDFSGSLPDNGYALAVQWETTKGGQREMESSGEGEGIMGSVGLGLALAAAAEDWLPATLP